MAHYERLKGEIPKKNKPVLAVVVGLGLFLALSSSLADLSYMAQAWIPAMRGGVSVRAANGTRFTYQRRLTDSGNPDYPTLADAPMLPRDFTLPIPLFAPDSAWNHTATGAAVLPESDQQVLVTYRVLHGDTTSLYPPGPADWFPVTWVNFDEFTIPLFRAGQGQQNVLICDYDGNLEWPSPKFGIDQLGGPVPVPAPAGMVRPANPQGTASDGHLVLYQPDTFMTYDFWQATTQRNGQCGSRGAGYTGTAILEAGAVDFFDVRGSGANVDTYSSARATGPPLLAGLLLPEDVESGAISHALALAIPGPRNLSSDPFEPLPSDYFYPASTTETEMDGVWALSANGLTLPG